MAGGGLTRWEGGLTEGPQSTGQEEVEEGAMGTPGGERPRQQAQQVQRHRGRTQGASEGHEEPLCHMEQSEEREVRAGRRWGQGRRGLW